MQAVAEKAQLNQTQIYRTLSAGGNPELRSISAILRGRDAAGGGAC
jgi:DNA-binding phage protein